MEIAELTDHITKLQNGNICLNLKSSNDDLNDDLRKQNELVTEDSNVMIKLMYILLNFVNLSHYRFVKANI